MCCFEILYHLLFPNDGISISNVNPKLPVFLSWLNIFLSFCLFRLKVKKNNVLPKLIHLIAFYAGLLQSVSTPKGGACSEFKQFGSLLLSRLFLQ